MLALRVQTSHQIFSLILSETMNGITALALGLALKSKNTKNIKETCSTNGILTVNDIITLIF